MTTRTAMPAGKSRGKRLAPCRSTGRSRGGFTLIELLVACGLMAVLALLSWRGLDSVLQTRERLVVASDELRSLTLAFSQMDEDLLRSWPVSMLKLNESHLRVEVSGENNAQSLYLIREANRTGFPTRVQRVIYQVRDGQLARGFSSYGRAALNEGAAVGGGSVQAIVWQPILSGVRSISLRGWVEGRGWLDAVNLAGLAAPPSPGAPGQPSPPQRVVVGIEVVLERMDGQRFLRVFSVKD